MVVVERITSLSSDTLKRHFPELIVKLSPGRDGMKLRDAIAIANGAVERKTKPRRSRSSPHKSAPTASLTTSLQAGSVMDQPEREQT
jgi:hypothetical protein